MSLRTAPMTSHYEESYFRYQSRIGEFGGWANISKFAEFITPGAKVLDFGCGGGYLLAHLKCTQKVGIEVNPFAREVARHNGIQVVGSASEIEDGWADVLISNHALEHCRYPLPELQALLCKVAPGGRVIFVVPCESIRNRYRNNDSNHHLYSWSPMSAANLFAEAGFKVLESRAYIHVWPPRFIPRLLRSIGGRPLFEIGCSVYGWLTYWNLTPAVALQLRVIAER
ncbi:MAG TPA: class I SAM-dependent methyltransferase [Candidatus Eremiobacteraceae bacterium]|nr:class I SAM-dependent methyltransferase [Candidatus Eremiobacteraceae bacterium]